MQVAPILNGPLSGYWLQNNRRCQHVYVQIHCDWSAVCHFFITKTACQLLEEICFCQNHWLGTSLQPLNHYKSQEIHSLLQSDHFPAVPTPKKEAFLWKSIYFPVEL